MLNLEDQVRTLVPLGITGRINRLVGTTASVSGLPAPMSAVCRIHREQGLALMGEVVGFDGPETLIVPYGDWSGVRRGNRVELLESMPRVRVGDSLLGRVMDGQGRFLDDRPAPLSPHRVLLHREPISPLKRPPIDTPLGTGIRAIDGLLTCGQGQRIGIFAGSGVGKSHLLGQLARSSTADVNVVVLVGERGREVREFLEKNLGPEGLAKSVVVVATSDEAAVLRLRAAFLGTAIAEYFRDTGKNVLLLMDSVTRFAAAQREIGVAAGESSATRGFPPSVFAMLPKLLERTGRTEAGTITAFYTVLVEGDDPHEPITDAVRGILDGHIVLSRKLAQRGHWPAIDVLASLSRLFPDLSTPGQRAAAQLLRKVLAAHAAAEDLINLGAYQKGGDPVVDVALEFMSEIQALLQQSNAEQTAPDATMNRLRQVADQMSAALRI
ncbi:MAG: type secretion system ATPase, FliI/YscN [Planctomycetaceae bacterium]|nr:type secretion system ATPase, FliI/YscN [Planctomycetaceae bacterium]